MYDSYDISNLVGTLARGHGDKGYDTYDKSIGW
jgi:hypothetical protein